MNRNTKKKVKRAKPPSKAVIPKTHAFNLRSWGSNIIPPETDVTFEYILAIQLGTSAINDSYRFTVNCAYDVDPTLGSTSTPGFSEWSNLYTLYRVIRVSYSVQATNTDLQYPAIITTKLANNDPTITMPYVTAGNALTQQKTISPMTGDNTCTLRGLANIATVAGTDSVETADSYSSVVTGVPADKIWLGIGVTNSTLSTPLSAPVYFTVRIKMITRMYSRAQNLLGSSEGQESFEAKRHAFKLSQGQTLDKRRLPKPQ